jgi:AbrB family looped-hinge helix DNA binding protein
MVDGLDTQGKGAGQKVRGRGLSALTKCQAWVLILVMIATLSDDGLIVIPPELRDNAQLRPGDTLDVQLFKGTIVLRKHRPLTPEECAALLERSYSQPQPMPEDEAAVEQAIREARARQR